ncbi:MAG: L-glutamate gamma-semialdehyde dehydrogenase, partial [Janthinobacterium lividum]
SQILDQAADLLDLHRFELMALAVREAGKSLPNALAEVREAVDFLRYYAGQCIDGAAAGNGAGNLGIHDNLDDSGNLGTHDNLDDVGDLGNLGNPGNGAGKALGVVTCISPWNFPLAIFIGQVSAALAAGNVVLAKPAEQTPLIAFRATQLLHEAGVPRAALQLLPGRGETVGASLCADARVDGVVFTGSTDVAGAINRTLAGHAAREQRLVPLIAETGGMNAMIVDSSALTEQVVADVLASAFDSAGQRCSALRVLCLQEDIAERTLGMLRGALDELRIGVPDRLAIDIGPVIDEDARAALEQHVQQHAGRLLYRMALPNDCAHGSFVAPAVIAIDRFGDLQREVFGPVLHVLVYRREALPQLLAEIRASGYGLTLGIHTRIDETITAIVDSVHVGNVYVNRNIVGAVVGVQPFGGEGKSGTGPKAGGPLYLARLRHGVSSLEGLRMTATRPQSEDASQLALARLKDWAGSARQEVLLARIREYERQSLLGHVLALPGPTGETNTLRFAARGTILCAAADRAALVNQLAATLATGNLALLSPACATLLPADLPAQVMARVAVAKIDEEEEIAAALWDVQASTSLVETLAGRHGALVPLVSTNGTQPIALWRLLAERSLCVNTTAAGGNASLMMLGAE